MGLTIEPPGPAITSGAAGVSISNHGAITSATAGQAIATIAAASLTAGVQYLIDVYAYADGTLVAATDDDNMRVEFNGASLGTIPFNADTADASPYKFTIPVSPAANGTNSLQIQAIAAATTGAVYHATVVATPLGA